MRLIGIVTFLLVGSAVAAAECARTVADDVDEPPFSRLFWYGSDSLAVRIARDGYWYGMGPERSFGDKLFIRSSGFRPGQESGLKVRGTRIDGDSERAQVSSPTNAHDASFGGWAMLVGVSLPSAGCWEFEVSYLGQELKFVVETRKEGKLPQGVATPPNKVLQLTLDPAGPFAATKGPSVSRAAERSS